MDQRKLDSRLLAMQDAVLTGEWGPWLEGVAEDFGATRACVVPLTTELFRPVQGFAVGFSEIERCSYSSYFGSIDTLWYRAAKLPSLKVSCREELSSGEGYKHGEFYCDYYSKLGCNDGAMVALDSGPGRRFLFALHRGTRDQEFSSIEQQQVGRIASFLSKAMSVAGRLALLKSEASSLTKLLDRDGLAVLMLERGRAVESYNRVADALLNTEQHFRIVNGQLFGVTHVIEKQLEDALFLIREQNAEEVSFTTPAPALSHVTVFRVKSSDRLCPSQVMIAIASREPTKLPSPSNLAQMFGITPREADALSLLVSGCSVRKMAAAMGISENGVRYHLKQIYLKTETTGQRDLTRFTLLVLSQQRLAGHVEGAADRRLSGTVLLLKQDRSREEVSHASPNVS